jgi:hypothetical protein
VLLNRIRILLLISMAWLFVSLMMTSDLYAQQPSADTKALTRKEKKRAEVSFEDELVTGEVKKPELFYLLQKKQFNYKRLIKLRENFLPEMKRTATEIQRGGSVD